MDNAAAFPDGTLAAPSGRAEAPGALPIPAGSPQGQPLTLPQQAIYLDSLLRGATTKFNMGGALLIPGPLVLEAFRRSLAFALARHDAQRTRILAAGANVAQVFVAAEDCPLPFQFLDYSERPEPLAAALEWVLADFARPMGLEQFPLHADVLFRLGPKLHLWYPKFHHMVGDAFAHALIAATVGQAYRALIRTGCLPELPPRSYQDFIREDGAYAGSERFLADRDFWRATFQAMPEPLPFTLRKAGLAEPSLATERCTLSVDRMVYNAILLRAEAAEVSPFQLLLACLFGYLHRATGRDDIVIGTPILNRSNQAFRATAGMFMNMMPLRLRIAPAASILELARQIRSETRSCYRHQRFPLAETLRHCRTLDGFCQGVFDVTLVYRKLDYDVGFGGPPMRVSTLDTGEREESLSLEIDEYNGDQDVNLFFNHQPRQLPAAEVAAMARSFHGLLTDLALAGDLPLAAIRLESGPGPAAPAAAPAAAGQTVLDLVRARAAAAPAAEAVLWDGGRLTRGELAAAGDRVAGFLAGSCAVTAETPVAVLCDRDGDWLIALTGVLKAGCAYLPLDPEQPRERLAFILQDSGCRLLLAGAAHARAAFPGVRTVPVAEAAAGAPAAPVALGPERLAYIIYTSGTSGEPKGVLVEHGGIRNTVLELLAGWGISDQDRVLGFAGPMFDASIVDILLALAAGAPLVLAAKAVILDPARFLALLGEQGVTVATLPPAYLSALGPVALPLRLLVTAGEAAHPADVARHLATLTYVNAYGPTEASVCASYLRLEPGSRLPDGRIPIGPALGRTRILVLDDQQRPVALGAVGELCLAGAGLARGYLGRPELTRERFLPNPLDPGERLYRTGDLGRRCGDGFEFLGRADRQVKIRGYRVELGEIEALLRTFPGLQAAAVTVTGAGELVAHVVAPAFEPQELRRFLAAKVPAYMVPAAYVRLPELPVNGNGKLDHAALPAPAASAYASSAFEPPRGAVETRLAALWAAALGLPLDRLGRHDHFFELGGHSLMALALVERMRQEGLQADVQTLFSAPTLAELAAALGRPGSVAVPPSLIQPGCARITPELLPLAALGQAELDRIVAAVPGGAGNVQDIYPLSPLQEGILFHHLLGGPGDPYLLASQLPFPSRERLDGFVAALRRVVARHDILRTALAWEGLAEPVQVVWRQADLPVAEVQLDPARDPGQQLRERFDPRAQRIDLRQAPLLRLHCAGGPGPCLLLLQMHHLIGDHTTLKLVLEEVQAHQAGQAGQLPRPVPFRNLVAQARLGLSRAEHETFFRALLGGVSEPTAPFGLLDVQGDGGGTREARLRLEPGLAGRIRQRASRAGVSAASLCHQAWALVLARLTGREDVVFGTVLFGRMQGGEGADRALGLFINTLPALLPVDGAGVEAGLRRSHALLAELMRHEHASLVLAQRCSAVPAPAPLFTTLLNYRHSPEPDGLEPLAGEEASHYPISLDVDDLGVGFQLTAQVHSSLDPEQLCAAMATALERLVTALETAPATPLRSLDVLPAAERRRLLETWNATQSPVPANTCVHQLFEQQAARNPGALALIQGERRLSYGELNRRANRLAQRLGSLGVGPDRRVAICAARSPELIIGLLAILKAGGAYVPLDPANPAERLDFLVGDSGPVALLSLGGAGAGLAAVRAGELPVLDLAQDCADQPDGNPDPAGLSARNLAYVIHTSGSTGSPKGVLIEHRSAVNCLSAQIRAFGLGPGLRVLQFAACSFDVSVEEIFSALGAGATLVLRDDAWLGGAGAFWERCAAFQVNLVDLPTRFWQLLAGADQAIPACVQTVIIGGEAVEPAALARWFQRPGHRPSLFNAYGPTETTVNATLQPLTADPAGWRAIGRPMANTRIYILDPQGRPAPVGVAGELHIGGAGLARGYLNRTELTAERFLADPFNAEPGARIYRTGDLGHWLADGTIAFLGRNDLQVKLRGFRIELGEIEARLREHPEVGEAVVTVAGSDGDPRLVAYFTADTAPAAEALRAHLAASLPEHMLPAAFLRLPAMPMTSHGKLDRAALPEPDASAFAGGAFEPPQGPTELALAALWAELLKVDRVGRHDHFFERGGHSLLAIQVVARLRQSLGLEVPLGDLFAHPVLADFARRLAASAAPELPPVTAGPRPEPIPLSLAQQRLWFLARLDGASPTYHMAGGLRLRGPLDWSALGTALDRILARHEALRTTFGQRDGTPFQRVAEPGRFPLLEGTAATLAELERIMAEEAAAPFDLERGPLVRGRLLREGPDRHTLLVTMHHIVSDGRSVEVFLRELGELYRAQLEGRPDPLPALAVQYPDYALWQRRHLSGPRLQAQAEVWQRALAGAPGLLELPSDRPRPAQQDHAGGRLAFRLEPALAAGLRALGLRHGATLFMTLLAGWAALLSRLSGQEQLVIGTPSGNRGRRELESVIGFFVNTLALRLDLSGGPTVAELLARVKARTLEAQANPDLPFEQVVELLRPARSLAHSPLFQVLFAWQNPEETPLRLPGLELEVLAGGTPVATFDLTLDLQADATGIHGELVYATALFDPATVARFLAGYRTLLAAMVAGEAQPVAGLEMLPAAERTLLLETWNATATPFSSEHCAHQLFEAQVRRTPAAPALVHGEQTLSYQELERRANRLAQHLRGLGVNPDDRVAICAPRGLEMVVAVLAVLKAGGAYVPLDPAYPVERLAFMLRDSQAVLLLGRNLPETLAIGVPQVDLDQDFADQPEHALDPVELGLRAHHLAYVIYTSGSTGQPKGVMVEHRGLCNLIEAQIQAFAVEPASRVLQVASFSFDACISELMMALCRGAALHLPPPGRILAGAALLDELRERRITHVTLTPAVLAALPETAELASLQTLIVAGEALPEALQRRWAGGRRLINAYGPTEATVCATLQLCQAQAQGPPPIGRPIANVRVYLLDPLGQPTAIGVAGELYIGGAGVARGYLGRPELTAERFLPDPFNPEPGARMYRTGDLGRWLPDGSIAFLGRNDLQIKLRGIRIELGEIEARLLDHPAVRAAALSVQTSPGGEPRLVAYYTAGSDLPAAELRAQLAASLPEPMLPAVFLRLPALPLTGNGKLDRAALPAAVSGRAFEPPADATETALAALWAELLQVERVGRLDNFFELGGHSLLAVTLVERMRRLGLYADVRALFEHPVLGAFAAALEQAQPVPVPPNLIPPGCAAITPAMLPLVALSPAELERIAATVPGGMAAIQDIYPLSPLQEGILFHHRLGGAGDPYLLCTLLALPSRERLDAFVQALQGVVDRHDILRTALLWEDLAEPVQVVWRQATLALQETRLEPSADAAAQLLARWDSRSHRIELGQAPMLRLHAAADPGQGRWLLLIRLHHLAGDHTTLEVLRAEIQALLDGHGERLPEPLPFRNLVAQARLGVSPAEHEAFFRDMLGAVREPCAPFGLLEVHGDGGGIREARLDLAPELGRRLRRQARRLGVSAASLSHQAWALVLARLTGREEVVFGTVLFGRMQGGEGAERAMGLFINTLPVRITVAGEGAAAGVRRSHRTLAGLLRHEHASLALAQRCSGVPAPAPLFTTLLNHRHGAAGNPAWAGVEVLQEEERTSYPLTLSVDDLGAGFALTAQAQAPLEPLRICAFMATALEQLVAALETAPEAPLASLDVLPAAERRLLLETWNATAAPVPAVCVHQLFEAQVRRRPEAVAVVFGPATLDYRELNRRANRLAHRLRELGVGPDRRVAICVGRSLELVIGLLAILKAGGAFLPLDPDYPAERLAFMLSDSAPAALITLDGRLRELAGGLPVVDLGQPGPERPETDLDPAGLGLDPGHLAYVIYTSGSTGQPKGVLLEHRSLVNHMTWMQATFPLGPEDPGIFKTPFSFDASVWEWLAPLLAGSRLVVAEPGLQQDPAALVRLLRAQAVHTLQVVPTLLGMLLETPGLAACSALRRVFCGGEALPDNLIARFQACLPGVELINLYGPTEATIDATFWRCPAGGGPVAIGRPIANTQVYLLDPQGRPAPVGVAGELHLGGAGLARGYLNRPELTAERFLPDRFRPQPGARLYRTGDLGRWLPDGTIGFLGRNDFQVKLRGFRIELGEIEARLGGHPGIREVVVTARPDPGGEPRLVAYYTAEVAPPFAELRALLAADLPEAMIPTAFVRLPALPLTVNGKLDRAALPEPGAGAGASRAFQEPRGPAETALAAVWAELLKLARVGRLDNFFELGGHSLLVLRALAMLERAGLSATVADCFAHPTLAALAARLVPRAGAGPDQALPIRAGGAQLPLFLVHDGAGSLVYGSPLAACLAPELPVYGLPLDPAGPEAVRSLPAMAERMVRLLRAVQAEGPYRLAGYSSGGLLAYEIARQLLAQGQAVALLALFDTRCPDPAARVVPADPGPGAFLLQVLRDRCAGAAQALEPLQALSAGAGADLAILVAQCRELGLLPDDLSPEAVRTLASTSHAIQSACGHYRVEPIAIPVHLFTAQAEAAGEVGRSWAWLPPGERMRLVPVAGDHHSMLQAPNLENLGRLLAAVIEAAGQESESEALTN